MKVFEILRSNESAITEEALITQLKKFDWQYEFAEDARRQRKGHQQMNVLENMVYQLWKSNPEKAVHLWNTYSPYGNDGITPSFILRLQSQDR